MITNNLLDNVFLPLKVRIGLDMFNEDLERFTIAQNVKKLHRVYILTNKCDINHDYYNYWLYLILCSELERIY